MDETRFLTPAGDAATTTPERAERSRALRLEVGMLRRRETRRVFGSSVHVGSLGGPRDAFQLPLRDAPVIDDALRTDILCALVERTPQDHRTSWLVRPGDPDPLDSDAAWLGAARRAFALHERPLAGFYVVTRYGWRDAETGECRAWKRLRV